MMSVIPILAGVTLILGAGLVALGVRGRRIDEHPVCHKCRFDLAGVYPAIETCPECGRELSGQRAVRIGNRRKRRLPLGVGVGLLAVALLIGGLMVTVLVGGPALNPYKPVWMLGIEARSASAKRAGDAIDELVSRFEDAELSERQVGWFVEVALDEHADDQDPNEARWIQAIEIFYGAGELSDEQFGRYLSQSVVLDVALRDRVRVGEPIPFQVVATDARWGAARRMMLEVIIAEAGTPMPEQGSRFLIQGRRGSGSGTSSHRDTLSGRTNPGPARIDLSVRVRVREFKGFPNPPDLPILATIERTYSLETELIEGDTVRVVTPTDELRAAMRAAVTIPRVQFYGVLNIDISRADPPMDGVFQMYIRVDGQEHRVRDAPPITVHRGSGVTTISSVIASSASQFIKETQTIDIILRPDIKAAREMVGFDEIYGEDIVIKGIPITRPGG